MFETHNRLASATSAAKRPAIYGESSAILIEAGKKTHPSHHPLSLDLITAKELVKKHSQEKP